MDARNLSLTLIAFLGLTLGATAASARIYNRVVRLGSPMPSFESLPATDGTTLSSHDLKADVVILVFLANHCPWVRGMDGDLVRLVSHFGDRSVRLVGVSINHRQDDRLAAMKDHAARAGYNFTYVYDESQDLGRELGATHTPEYFVFGKDRRLAYMGLLHDSPAMMRRDGSVHYTRGRPTHFYVEDAIDALLAGRPVKIGETAPRGCSLEYTPTGKE
ncbi:MAG TPA: thioredoxin family protein [Thermoanaerobaculia bacterium]|nr:thioredoxin family protein [Thermoanaerobaculia bacterium]